MDQFLNFDSDVLIAVGIITLASVLMLISTLRLRNGGEIHLRPINGFKTLEGNIGRATESASLLHLSLGQASLTGAANPTSIAALTILDYLAKEGFANGNPPIVTVGDGTLLIAAQERMDNAHRESQKSKGLEKGDVQFIANNTDSFTYASGVATLIQQNKVISNVLVGHFGPELGIMTDAADRKNVQQIIGADDPIALALGSAATNDLLIGEELFAGGAYLEGNSNQLASLQAQDILRLLLALSILGVAIYQLVAG